MQVLARTAILAAAVCLAAVGIRADDDSLLARTNAWKPGDPVPTELLHDRSEPSGCIPVVPANVAAIYDTTNDALLLEMLVAPCDQRMFDNSVDAAFVRMGASRFLTALRERYAAHPKLLARSRQHRLYLLTKRRHVTVDCLYIEDEAMSDQKRDDVLAGITAELRAGTDFTEVRKKYSDAYEYSEHEVRKDGTDITLHLTHIGNNGDFILTAQNHSAINRAAEVPAEHVRPLLAAKHGDVLILRNQERHRLDLYFVREVYDPANP